MTQSADLPQQDLCSGYIWLGAKGDGSRLDDHRDPATVAVGDLVTLDQRADIRLRAALPDPVRYTMAPLAGLVPAGARVKILDAPVVYKRSQDQIWVQAGVPKVYCTTVYLQYVGSDATRDTVVGALGELGVQAPPAQLIQSAKGLAEVRYYWPADKMVAEQVAATLARFNKGKPLKVVTLLNYPTKPASGTMEVWLDLDPGG